MYKQVETDKEIRKNNGVLVNPVATLADEYGGRCEIYIDDHCYVLCLRQEDSNYKNTPWIFREAHNVLKTLPELEL